MLHDLKLKNAERQSNWEGSDKIDMLFRMVELCGEGGELANAVKKLYRQKHGILGNKSTDTIDSITENVIEELGDVVICADLLASSMGIDLEEAVRTKFNKTSKKVGIEVYL